MRRGRRHRRRSAWRARPSGSLGGTVLAPLALIGWRITRAEPGAPVVTYDWVAVALPCSLAPALAPARRLKHFAR
jgi:hypothetical protein